MLRFSEQTVPSAMLPMPGACAWEEIGALLAGAKPRFSQRAHPKVTDADILFWGVLEELAMVGESASQCNERGREGDLRCS
jgi:hypothetical protein